MSNTIIANSTTSSVSGGDIAVTGALTLSQVLTDIVSLSPLHNNGGATWTMALPGGSPAIDAGAGCPPSITDQRGVARMKRRLCSRSR